MRGIGWAVPRTPPAKDYQLPQPLPQLFQPLRQLFQLLQGEPPPKPKLPHGRPQPQPPPPPHQLPQARRRSPAVSLAAPTADTASRIAASRSDTRSPWAAEGCTPTGCWLAAPGAVEPSSTAMPSAPGVTSLDTTFRYFCRSDNGTSLIIDRWRAPCDAADAR